MSLVRLSTLGVRVWRMGALCLAAFFLHRSAPPVPLPQKPASLAEARAFFPSATSLRNQRDGSIGVFSGEGGTLGRLLSTSPQSDGIVGYSGPSNLLVALGKEGEVIGVRVLSSGDTSSHVRALQEFKPFWSGFHGWHPGAEALPKVEALGGSTLTSLAMAESLVKRLVGSRVSLRFPEPVTLSEVQTLFPSATQITLDMPRPGWIRVTDSADILLGFVLRTSPASDDFSGYAGPTECLVAVTPDQQSIGLIKIRKSYDTDEYVERVREDEDYLKRLAGWKIREWPKLDFQQERIEGVAGATLTSYAIAEGLKRRFTQERELALAGKSRFQGRDLALLGIVLGALLMSFTGLRGKGWMRAGWQVVLIGGLGLWSGQFLSLALFSGWAKSGVDWEHSLGILLLAGVALLVPWGTRRQIYCHQVCPHGAAQEWLGRFPRLHVRVPSGWNQGLSLIPVMTLGGALLFGMISPSFDLSQLEPFDAWILRGGAGICAVIAGVGLVASLFVPQAYCRYGCPTGALLKFVRSSSSQEGFGRKDWGACVLLAVACCVAECKPSSALVAAPPVASAEAPQTVELRGSGFGTTWCVKIRGIRPDLESLRSELSAEVDRIERTLSPWRVESATSRFNAAETTDEMVLPEELIRIVAFSQTLSRASEGAYDITVAPLVSAWGYGPEGVPATEPSVHSISGLLERVGWQKLLIGGDGKTLRKTHPKLRIVLSLLQGYAVDHLSEILLRHQCSEHLIELGGELLARGAWQVAIEDPSQEGRVLRKMTLRDSALATSGLYRARRKANGKEISHILSPQTGLPVEPTIELCSVAGPTCLEAKGWVTTLIASGLTKSKQMAAQLGLEVLWVERDGTVSVTPGAVFSLSPDKAAPIP